MSATVIQFPRTPQGRDLLSETMRTIRSAETRVYVATLFDWDGSAIEMRRQGFAPASLRQRVAS
jgi:hypothetical protein